MTRKDREFIHQATGAGVFYNRGRRAWCALWFGAGHEHRLYFGRCRAAVDVVTAIMDQKTKEA